MMQVGRSSTAAEVRRAGWVGLVVNLLLAMIKMAAGIVGHSHAVVADAVHSLSDLVTDFALIVGVHFWSKPADEDHPHGHHRIETLVTVVIGLLLGGVAVGLVVDAVTGGHRAGEPTPGGLALAAALLSIAVKEALYRWTAAVGERVRSPALVANAWHHRSDALSSLPAAVAVAVALVNPSLAVVDRIGAVVVCGFILYAAWRIVTPALAQLVDTAAPPDQRRRLEALALSVTGVLDAHALRTRYVGPNLAVDLHVVVAPDLNVEQGHAIGESVRRKLIDEVPEVHDVLVKVEPDDGPRDT
jgi:cation diffusion facilitator family transporter